MKSQRFLRVLPSRPYWEIRTQLNTGPSLNKTIPILNKTIKFCSLLHNLWFVLKEPCSGIPFAMGLLNRDTDPWPLNQVTDALITREVKDLGPLATSPGACEKERGKK